MSDNSHINKSKPKLTDVPETMLWTLHNRANEAMRSDNYFIDPRCIEIYQSIDYDYEKSFGKAESSHAARSVIFDAAIDDFLKRHPDGIIINLGEGLETQRYRFANNPRASNTSWFSIDLPNAINIRETYIKPDKKHQHISLSATNTSWFEQVPNDKPVFITAQGLFMYFEEAEVAKLITAICNQFKQGEIMFDTIPQWLSAKTLSEEGWQKTEHYTTPRMPWGINRNEISDTILPWSSHIQTIEEVPFNFPRGIWHWLMPIMKRLPVLKNKMPSIQKISFKQ